MATNFPSSNDSFNEPGAPGTTPLNSPGTGSRKHSVHHRDLGDAVEGIEANIPLLTHDHSTSGSRATSKLAVANTHQSPDTDGATTSLHHTLGTGALQGAAGNHTHTQAQSHGSPDTDTAISSLHHTTGVGATQGAPGNHTHTQAQSHGSPDTDSATSSLHHTLGTSSTQAAIGSHKHPGSMIPNGFTASQSSSAMSIPETVIMTAAGNVTLKVGEAYRLELGGLTATTLNRPLVLRVRKTNISGVIIAEFIFTATGPSFSRMTYIKNDTGSDISFTPCISMVSTIVNTNCTVSATSAHPRFMAFTYVGNASDFTNAISVT